MPRDGTKNLVPQSKRTKAEQKEIAKKGGIASGKARKEKADMRKAFELLLSMDGGKVNGEVVSNAMAIAATMIDKAKKGDIQAAIFARDTAGQNPRNIQDDSEKLDKIADTLVQIKEVALNDRNKQ